MGEENISPNNGNNIFKFLEKSYKESLYLLNFARDYFSPHGAINQLQLSREDSLIYTLAMSTITSQLTSVFSWLLLCRAVQNGEVKIEDLKNDNFRMPDFDLIFKDENSRFLILNETVKTLLNRSCALYTRIKRIETSIQLSLSSRETEEAFTPPP
jgi:hypothetical protein